ncbi:MAG: DUF4153 domain-containing protein, partial [Saprospiraceae bacterium]|nr:DUF4153 domain-containing protein [Saprospiraceae bacterium]
EQDLEEQIIQLLMTAFMAWPFFIGLRFAEEKYQLSRGRALLVKALALGFFIIYFYYGFGGDMDKPEVMIRYMALVLFGHLYVSFAAFREAPSLQNFWTFNQKILLNFLEAGVVAVILGAGLSLALLALQELFKVDVKSTTYLDLNIIVAGIFHPLYFLSKAPVPGEDELEAYTSARAFTNIVKYVLIPLTGLYFIILYAFSLKILISWELPEGWVSKMVLGFSVAGIFTYLVNYRMADNEDSSILSAFKKWYFPVLAPMVILIMVAIGRRISDYGFTEGRYIVLVLGIWIGLVCLYFILSKRDDIRIIPFSLAVVSLLAVTGPWRASKVSFNSQMDRLKGILETEGLYANGAINPSGGTVAQSSINEITNILYFLVDRDTQAVRTTLSIPTDVAVEVYPIMKTMDLKPDQGGYYNDGREYRTFTLLEQAVASTDGFENLKTFQLYGSYDNADRIINLQSDGAILLVAPPGGESVSIDVGAFAANLFKNKDGQYNIDKLTLPFEKGTIRGKVIFDNVTMQKEDDQYTIQSAQGSVLWSP